MKIESARQIFDKYPNTKFNGNPSSCNLVNPYGRTDGRMERRTEERADRQIWNNAFRNFANLPKTRELLIRFINTAHVETDDKTIRALWQEYYLQFMN
jgi:hypothetical protein